MGHEIVLEKTGYRLNQAAIDALREFPEITEWGLVGKSDRCLHHGLWVLSVGCGDPISCDPDPVRGRKRTVVRSGGYRAAAAVWSLRTRREEYLCSG